MDVFEAVRTLLAVRQYQDKPIPDWLVRRIVEAGQLTASSQNKQPWHFVVVEDRAQLTQLGDALPTGPYVAQAAMAIAVAIQRDSPSGVSDGSRAIQSMMLTAWASGVGSNWVGSRSSLDAVGPLLGIPDEYTLLAVLPFGYPAKAVGRGKKQRKPLEEIASRGRFGTPFE